MASRSERRRKQRVQLTRGIMTRLGAMPAVMLDVTDVGARIEHFARLDVGKRSRFRFAWRESEVEVEAVVVSCKVHRFAHGDEGTTVYQSGIRFTEYVGDAATYLREMVASLVARSLAEQVANARGIGPVTQETMPVFRAGDVMGTGVDASKEQTRRLLGGAEVVIDRGYVRCTLISGNRWEKKWSRSSEQPPEGFTVLASEPSDHVEKLCETYMNSGPEERQLIRILAQVSVEKTQETPEPR